VCSSDHFESTRHGYGIIDLKEDGATLEFWYVPHEELSQEQVMAKALFVASGQQRITREDATISQGRKRASPAPQEAKLYQSPGEVGGQGGDYFYDAERLRLQSRLTRIRVRSGDRVDALAVDYDDGLSLSHGGAGGTEQSLELNSGEYLRRMTVSIGKRKGATTVHYVKLTTSQGCTLEAGKKTATAMDYAAEPGRHIAGFRGRAGRELDKLGPIFAPDFET